MPTAWCWVRQRTDTLDLPSAMCWLNVQQNPGCLIVSLPRGVAALERTCHDLSLFAPCVHDGTRRCHGLGAGADGRAGCERSGFGTACVEARTPTTDPDRTARQWFHAGRSAARGAGDAANRHPTAQAQPRLAAEGSESRASARSRGVFGRHRRFGGAMRGRAVETYTRQVSREHRAQSGPALTTQQGQSIFSRPSCHARGLYPCRGRRRSVSCS